MNSDPQALMKRMYTTLVELCPQPLTPAGMHGAFAGVALSPRPAVPNTWLPVLYNMPGEMPEFADRDQARNFLDTAVLAYNGVVASLTAGEFDFPFPVEEAEGAELARNLQAWCEGFIRGLRCTGVEAADYDQDFVNLMSPIAFCARPEFFDAAGSSTEQEQRIRRIAAEMPANLTALRNYFYIQLQRQRAAGARRPGRNDPCSCGSGRKFKHCCGKSESDA